MRGKDHPSPPYPFDVQSVDNTRTIVGYRPVMGRHAIGRLMVTHLALEEMPCRMQQESANRR